MRCALVIPTYNAGAEWSDCLQAVLNQTWPLEKRLVIDSQSADDTVALAEKAGFDTHIIDKSTFNHGGTRMFAVSMCRDCEVVIFLTQDAVLTSNTSLENIIACFEQEDVAAVCGRQLPRENATEVEAHARLYNYPDKSYMRSYSDRFTYGLKTAFISNSFAAYRVNYMKQVGGFPRDVIFGEDMYLATRLLEAGYLVAYASDACVYHSHSYTVLDEFRRYFDMGVFHAREPWVRKSLGGAESEGLKFVRSEVKYLLRRCFWRVPESLLRTACRYAGFRLGLLERVLPVWLKQQFVMNKRYFTKKS